MSPSRPAQSDDANIVFVHGSPERKSQKGQDANADMAGSTQELKHSRTREEQFVSQRISHRSILDFLSS